MPPKRHGSWIQFEIGSVTWKGLECPYKVNFSTALQRGFVSWDFCVWVRGTIMDFCSLGRPFFQCRCCCKNWLPKCNFLNLEAVKVDETHTVVAQHTSASAFYCAPLSALSQQSKRRFAKFSNPLHDTRGHEAQCILSSPEAKERRRKNFLHFSVLGIFHRLLCPCDYVIKKVLKA